MVDNKARLNKGYDSDGQHGHFLKTFGIKGIQLFDEDKNDDIGRAQEVDAVIAEILVEDVNFEIILEEEKHIMSF